MNMLEIYKSLAQRNGWDLSIDSDGNRLYFMKDGKYAVPNETTTQEDKELLASIISEGSNELERIILMCWDNGIIVTGPCSGIKEFHEKRPIALHFGMKASKEIVEPLYAKMIELFPTFDYMIREENGITRFDFNFFLNDKDFSKEESEAIFKVIADNLEQLLNNIHVLQ